MEPTRAKEAKLKRLPAVLALKQKPSTLHSDTSMTRYDDFVETHMEAMNAQSNTPSYD